MSRQPLTYGILMNEGGLQQWQLQCLLELQKRGQALPVLRIVKKNSAPATASFIHKIRSYPYHNFLFRLLKRFVFRTAAQETVNSLPAFISELPCLPIQTLADGRYAERFTAEDLEQIQTFRPDFLIRFGFNILRGDILHCCPLGILSFHHGDEVQFRGGPPGFWELAGGSRITSVVLQRLGERLDAGEILLKRSYRSIQHSYTHQLQHILSASADMPAQWVSMHTQGSSLHTYTPGRTEPIRRFPGNLRMLLFLVRTGKERIRFYSQKYFGAEKWDIALADFDTSALQLSNVRPLGLYGKGRYAADPFVYGDLIFYEHYDYRNKKGEIHAIRYRNGTLSQAHTVLKNATHFAFPFLFEWGNTLYLAPENYASGNWYAYPINRDTLQAGEPRLIFPAPLIDAVLLQQDDTWYIFAGLPGEANEKLHLWYAAHPFGPYEAHPCSPVKVNPAGSRMAGAVFSAGSHLVRPAQKSDRYYGEEILGYEITRLSRQDYEEKPLFRIQAPQTASFNQGIHTLNMQGRLCVTDLKKHASDIVSLAALIRR